MEDERDEEITTLSSIYEELVVDGYSISLELPVHLSEPLKIVFATNININGNGDIPINGAAISHPFRWLPPVQMRVDLPVGYPETEAPIVHLETFPQWLPMEKIEELKAKMQELWESTHGQVIFGFILDLQEEIDNFFHYHDTGLELDAKLRLPLLEFQARAEKADFDRQTFSCGVCLDPKKGSSCYRMSRCGHVFCKTCMTAFYTSCIDEGDVSRVQCMDPTCCVLTPRGDKFRPTIAPAELLQIPLTKTLVQRYAGLKRKKKIDADKSTVYCPRKWCGAPARSDKHPPLQDISAITEFEEPSAPSEEPPPSEKAAAYGTEEYWKDRLRICENERCQFAFCRICGKSWHGDKVNCSPPRKRNELSAEEKASLAYIAQNSTECPVCWVAVQKSGGCNHMTCFQCGTHFCYLCSSWLNPKWPYGHFNDENIKCYQRLFEMGEGDDGQANVQFGGARAAELDAAAYEALAADLERANIAA